MGKIRTRNLRAKNREWKSFLRWLREECAKDGRVVVVPIRKYQKMMEAIGGPKEQG